MRQSNITCITGRHVLNVGRQRVAWSERQRDLSFAGRCITSARSPAELFGNTTSNGNFDSLPRGGAIQTYTVSISNNGRDFGGSQIYTLFNGTCMTCGDDGLVQEVRVFSILNTTQPSYLYDLVSIQPPHGYNTRSSPYVTLTKLSSSSLKVTHGSVRHASPHLWNQLPISLRIPHPNHSSPSQRPSFEHAGLTGYTLLSPSITFSLFHSKLKPYLFRKSYPLP